MPLKGETLAEYVRLVLAHYAEQAADFRQECSGPPDLSEAVAACRDWLREARGAARVDQRVDQRVGDKRPPGDKQLTRPPKQPKGQPKGPGGGGEDPADVGGGCGGGGGASAASLLRPRVDRARER